MNGSKSPAPISRDGDAEGARDETRPAANGHRSPSDLNKTKADASPVPSIEAGGDTELPDACTAYSLIKKLSQCDVM